LRIKVRSKSGQPGVPQPRRHFIVQRKPMDAIRSIKTLIKRDEAEGRTMPEFKNTLQRAGVGARKPSSLPTNRQKPLVPPSTRQRASGKVISPPSPTNRGGVKKKYP
jgi:hypothetical protein